MRDTVLRDILFADDCTLNVSHEQGTQAEMDSFSSACDSFSFTINTKKTEIMFQQAPGNQYHEMQISIT